jgi:uncharacterized protein DUF4252
MKSTKTILKLASLIVVVVAAASNAAAQGAKIQISQLDALSAKASQTVDVNIDESLMQLTAKFLSSKDPDEAKVKDLVNGLKGIYVKSLEFETEGQYSNADLEGIRSQLKAPGWTRIVNVFSRKDGNLEVYLMHTGTQVSGLALLAIDPKEITVVNIVGPVDLDKLTQLEGQFGIPELEIEREKTKRKN